MYNRRRVQILIDALEKISDPRKRDHSEPDAYTQLGCVMNIADEALDKFNAYPTLNDVMDYWAEENARENNS